MRVHITVDVEVWPVHGGKWPHVPLDPTYDCRRELDAYFFGHCAEGQFGLPFQLETLKAHGLRATYFVDPMFSFALGIEPLREIVQLIQGAGQRVELHSHPEWLTDPRCTGLPGFNGPMIGEYPEEVQRVLIEIGLARLIDAGANGVTAFRAGSWGARVATLRAARRAGLSVDSSLNAHYPYCLDDLPGRLDLQSPAKVAGITELPVTRFDDSRTEGGRPLSVVGVSVSEMTHVLDTMQREGALSAVLVLHSNEFVKTENLWNDRPLVPRRWVARRFERICSYLAANVDRMETRFVADHLDPDSSLSHPLIRTGLGRTLGRLVGQAISRWH